MKSVRWLLPVCLGSLPFLLGMAMQDSSNAPRDNTPRARVTSPHGPLSIRCESCHSFTSWKPIRSRPEFNHDQTGFPLRGLHQKVTCMQCHTSLVFKNVSKGCADCHADIHRGQFPKNCEQCHTVKGWNVSVDMIRNHQNRFPLIGAHALADCAQCHTGAATGQFKGLSTSCFSCHQSDFHTPTLDHVATGFSANCETCHTMNTWMNAKFDHLKYTGFALTGTHAALPCTACHLNNNYKNTPATCYACHATDFAGTKNPSHPQLGLPHDCGTCHSTVNWLNAKFDHTLYANYPLTGLHANVACIQCHINNVYPGTSTTCYACHKADFTSTTNPNHVAGGLPTDCTTCHTTSGWIPSTFLHAKFFALTGAHATTTCAQCHMNNVYAGTPTTCYACHSTDFAGTINPPHVQLGLPHDCSTCHSTVNWLNAKFDHTLYGNYPLTGLHANVACIQCHINNVYPGTPTTCYACHKADFTGTTNPNHVAGGFPTDCTTCHTTSGWIPSSFLHSTFFALTGAHATTTCAQCHLNNVYAGTPTTCYGCHSGDFATTNNPPHIQLGLPHDCSTCHSNVNWLNAKFDHTLYGNYPLTGLHANAACIQCHVNNVYPGTPTTCYACHKSDFAKTTNPNHVSSGFPTDCSICHSTGGWTPSSFNHSTTTFPLSGAHTTLQCSACHVNGNFTTLPTDCYSCHKADYSGTTNPAHAAAGFPTTCTTCHTTATWLGATFDHNKTPFPLTGAHITVACNLCHLNNVFAGTPTDCYSCHKTQYTGTTNPNHIAAKFPTTCATCHTTATWLGAVFNHTYFNLNHGGANGVCATCHTNASDYSVFTCTSCHSKTSTDPKHQGINGYVYNSVNCYACHK